ncbi:MAG: hypothetical protein GY757_56425 [bacterium]|nr:hypothetical protein [bacterium]
MVPNYKKLVKFGIAAILKEAVEAHENVKAGTEESFFYQSVISALEGVQGYFKNYAALARKKCSEMRESQEFERKNLTEISARMDKLAQEPPGTFLEAIQLVFSMHCSLHIIGELISFGRLDQARLMQRFTTKFYHKQHCHNRKHRPFFSGIARRGLNVNRELKCVTIT